MKLEHTTLVIANNVQRQAIYRAVWQAWELPNGVSEAQGVANCRFGETLATADDGRLIYWALVARADTGGPDVLSAARTLRRDAKKRDTGDGQVADVTSYIGRAADAREGWVAKFDEELGWDVPSDDALVTAAAAPLLPNGWSSFPWVPPEISDKWKTLNASVQIRNRKEHLCALAWYGEEPVQDVHAIGGE
ncbi:hypothetical protein QFC19_000457 [Naganishia cerealis]|uniref:Uncharacterized protein n=1 Tax=Naganishia cerealis TaxID=610337 RepID=A0ACC2WPB8_9TREE|nr:hypothetical protein QFC19_000457 [Naganishia cerealis]